MQKELTELIKLSQKYLEISKTNKLEASENYKLIEKINKLSKKAYVEKFAKAKVKREQGGPDLDGVYRDVQHDATAIQLSLVQLHKDYKVLQKEATKLVETTFAISDVEIPAELHKNAWIELAEDKLWGMATKAFNLDTIITIVGVIESNQEKAKMIAEINAKQAGLKAKHKAILEEFEDLKDAYKEAQAVKEYYMAIGDAIKNAPNSSISSKYQALNELANQLSAKSSKMADSAGTIVNNIDKLFVRPLMIQETQDHCHVVQLYEQWEIVRKDEYGRIAATTYALNKTKLIETVFYNSKTRRGAGIGSELNRLNIIPYAIATPTSDLRRLFPEMAILEEPHQGRKSVQITEREYVDRVGGGGKFGDRMIID